MRQEMILERATMKNSSVVCLILALWASCIDSSVAKADDPASVPGSIGQRLLSIIDLVMAKHIDPPVRQQMILAGAKALNTSKVGQANEISKLVTDDEMIQYMDTLFHQIDEASRSEKESRFLQGLLEALPGGGTITTAKVAKVEEQLAANRYVGIGVQVLQDKIAIRIAKVLPGGTADKSGVKDNDMIIEVNGAVTAGKSLSAVVDELRGEEGSSVTLTLAQPTEAPRKVIVQRSVTFIATIQGKSQGGKETSFLIEEEPPIGYVKILNIGPSTAHELKTVEMELREHQIQGLILDFQLVTGQLHNAVMLADLFLEQGTIAKVRSLQGTEDFSAQPGSIFRDIPIAVVIQSPTAASSLFASALKENRQAKIFGSLGELYVKGSSVLPGGDQLTFTTGVLQIPEIQGAITQHFIDVPGSTQGAYDSSLESRTWVGNDLKSALTILKYMIKTNNADSKQKPGG
jgi:carboxyl-terminal processing protease